jgi:heptosyltransferase-2
VSASDAPLVVVAPNWLGDAVMALPALADLRRHFAEARVIVAARDSVADLFRLVPGIDDVIRTTWRGSVFRVGDLHADADAIRRSGAGRALLFPNSFASGLLVSRAGVGEVWGYATDLRARFLTRAVPRPRGSRHQGQYYQHLVRSLGIENGPLAPQLEIAETVRDAARHLLTTRGWDGSSALVVLAPGAAYGRAKQWLPAHVVELVATLTAAGDTCVFVGSRADAETIRQIRAALPATGVSRSLDVAGATSLAQLAGIMAIARACVTNDSGAMHIAAASGTPVIALFGPTIEAETRPLTAPGGWARVLTSPVWCRPCMLRECPLQHQCMSGITPAMVIGALSEVPSMPMVRGSSR